MRLCAKTATRRRTTAHGAAPAPFPASVCSFGRGRRPPRRYPRAGLPPHLPSRRRRAAGQHQGCERCAYAAFEAAGSVLKASARRCGDDGKAAFLVRLNGTQPVAWLLGRVYAPSGVMFRRLQFVRVSQPSGSARSKGQTRFARRAAARCPR